jgi:hypothetical protein
MNELYLDFETYIFCAVCPSNLAQQSSRGDDDASPNGKSGDRSGNKRLSHSDEP